MPKLKVNRIDAVGLEINAQIAAGLQRQQWNREHLALLCGITYPTFKRRMQNPRTWRLEEILTVADKLHIPFVDLFGKKEGQA